MLKRIFTDTAAPPSLGDLSLDDKHVINLVASDGGAPHHEPLCMHVKNRDSLTRIGTDSFYAEVYILDGKVLKVMPIMPKQTMRACVAEYNVQKILSSKYPEAVVGVYKGQICHAVFSKSSKFYERAHLYSFSNHDPKHIEKLGPSELKALNKFGYARIEETLLLKDVKDLPVPVFVMELDRMDCDLGQAIANGMLSTQKDFENIKAQVVDSLTSVHSEGIAHADLHLNNILVLRKGATTTLKLADFGKAESNASKTHMAADYFKLGTSLQNFSFLLGNDSLQTMCHTLGGFFVERATETAPDIDVVEIAKRANRG